MPRSMLSASARSRIGRIDSANWRAARSGGMPGSIRPLVMLMFRAPTLLAKSSVCRIRAVRSARCFAFGLIRLGSKYGSGGASFQYPKLQLALTLLTVSNVNANCSFGYWKDAPPEPYFEPSLISPNAKHRADRTALILQTLDFAKSVGARNISITSGRMLPGMPPDRAARQFAESILPILDRADALNIDLGIECEPGLYLEYVAELRDWIDRLNHPRLGANLDIGHSQ